MKGLYKKTNDHEHTAAYRAPAGDIPWGLLATESIA
jgi:hypothetical protein